MNLSDFMNVSFIAYIEAALIVLTFIAGFLANFISFLVIIKHKSFCNSFGYIIAYSALANSCILLIFAIWATPWTLFAVPESVHGANLFFGQTILFFQEVGFHGNLLLSINRFVAITFPLQYRLWFTGKSTLIMLLGITCLPLGYWTIFFIESCDICYDHHLRVWKFGTHPCSVFLATYVDVCYNIFLFVIIAVFDLISLVRLHMMKKKSLAHKGSTTSETNKMKRQHKKQVLLFVQAFLTSVVYSLTLLSFKLTPAFIPEGFYLFLGTTLAWESAHSFAGFVLIWFNPEIRRHLSVREFTQLFTKRTSAVFHITSSRN